MASIIKRGDNYVARVSVRDGNKYVQKQRTFPRKSMATKWANDLEVEKYTKDGVIETNELFSDFFKNWYHTFKENGLQPNTQTRYQNSIKTVSEAFAGTKLKDITRAQYQSFLNDYGVSHKLETAKKLHGHIRAAVKDAVDDGIINKDFTNRIKVTGLAGKNADEKYLELHDMENLIEELKLDINASHPTKTMALVALYTGLRYQEVIGLTWKDIDAKAGTVSVNKSWSHKTKDFGPTKNPQSVRTVKTDPELFEILENYHKSQLRLELTNPNNLIFAKKDGNPPSDNASNYSVARALTRINADKIITFHGLRHTHASYLIYKGLSLYAISKRLGHGSFEVTLNTYSHVLKVMEDAENEKILEALHELSS